MSARNMTNRPRRSGRVRLIVLLIVFGALTLFQLAQRMGQSRTKKNGEQRKVPVVLKDVTRGEITQRIEINGEIKGQKQVDVYPDVPGKVQQLYVVEGQFIGQNQLVATIDRSVVGMEYKPATVRSPIAGVVGKVYVDIGATVAPQTPMMMVADNRVVEGVLNVPEKYVPYFRIGQVADITIESYPDLKFKGTVYRKGQIIDPLTRTLQVKLRLVNEGRKMIPGNYADFSIKVKTLTDQVLVPYDALMDSIVRQEVFVVEERDYPNKRVKSPDETESPQDKNNSAVRILSRRLRKAVLREEYLVATRRRIKVGIVEGNKLQVLAGLKPGERVITLGKENVVEGAHLKPVRLASESETNL